MTLDTGWARDYAMSDAVTNEASRQWILDACDELDEYWLQNSRMARQAAEAVQLLKAARPFVPLAKLEAAIETWLSEQAVDQ